MSLAALETTKNSDAAVELAKCLSPEALVRCDEPLARRTTLRVGGPADIYVEPVSESDLAAVLSFCHQRGLPLFVLGRGSNVLIKDGGFRGVVICLSQPPFCSIEVRSPRILCGAGAKLKAVAVEAKRNALAGFEFLEGIPGSVGGALRMNAGAMGGSTFDIVETVRLMELDGTIREKTPREVELGYRSCTTLKRSIALGAVLLGCSAARETIAQRMNEFSRLRWKSQPAAPSAGCMFKNPVTVPAGKLIDELGLKGTQIGGARISLEHGNFIINEGNATAHDVLQLIELIRQRARAERRIELETEVEIIGE